MVHAEVENENFHYATEVAAGARMEARSSRERITEKDPKAIEAWDLHLKYLVPQLLILLGGVWSYDFYVPLYVFTHVLFKVVEVLSVLLNQISIAAFPFLPIFGDSGIMAAYSFL